MWSTSGWGLNMQLIIQSDVWLGAWPPVIVLYNSFRWTISKRNRFSTLNKSSSIHRPVKPAAMLVDLFSDVLSEMENSTVILFVPEQNRYASEGNDFSQDTVLLISKSLP